MEKLRYFPHKTDFRSFFVSFGIRVIKIGRNILESVLYNNIQADFNFIKFEKSYGGFCDTRIENSEYFVQLF